ncbi:MAG: SbmA/BacA-like family transporter, partial [Mycobacterium sp.]
MGRELTQFQPSITWGSALPDSLRWIAMAWVISAVCVLVVLVVVRFTTQWGRQYWRITRGYFTGPQAVGVWLILGVLLLSVITGVRLIVLLSYQGKDLYNGLQKAFQGMGADNEAVRQSGIHGFWMSLAIFCILAAIYIARITADIYLTQRFIIAWRVWLTDHLTADWLDGRAYYRTRFIDNAIDNPDQRIQQDIDIFTTGSGGTPNSPAIGTGSTLLFGAVNAVVSVISFAAILWNLSGGLAFLGFELPRAMFWIVI